MTSKFSQPVWGEVAMVRWGKRDWFDVVEKRRVPDSSFSDIDNQLTSRTRSLIAKYKKENQRRNKEHWPSIVSLLWMGMVVCDQ